MSPCSANQSWFWFCPLSLFHSVFCLLSVCITLYFPLHLVWKLNIQNHDHSRHTRGCLVQRGLTGGAASAGPAAMHRTASILHHVPGTFTSGCGGAERVVLELTQSTGAHGAVRTSRKHPVFSMFKEMFRTDLATKLFPKPLKGKH